MSYKIYYTGLTLKIEEAALHKDSVESDLLSLRNSFESIDNSLTKEEIFKEMTSIIEKFPKEENLSKVNYALIETAELIVRDENNNLVDKFSFEDLVEKAELKRMKSKVNIVAIEKSSMINYPEETFLFELEEDYFDKNNLYVSTYFLIEDMILVKEMFYKIKQIEFTNIEANEKTEIIEENLSILKKNSKGFDNKVIYSEPGQIFQPDIYINKFENNLENNVIQMKKLQISLNIPQDKFLTNQENVMDMIHNNFSFETKETFEGLFGVRVKNIIFNVNNSDSNFDLNSLEYNKRIKVDQNNKQTHLKVVFELLEDISLTKAVFFNKISSIFFNLDQILIPVIDNYDESRILLLNMENGLITTDIYSETNYSYSKEFRDFLMGENE